MHFSDDGSYDLSVERKDSKDFSGSDTSSNLSFLMNESTLMKDRGNKFTIEPNAVASYARTIAEFEYVHWILAFFLSLIVVLSYLAAFRYH